MNELRKHREGWGEFERQKRRFDEDLSIEQSVRIFLSLQVAYEPMMKETEELFRPQRIAYLAELQARLRRLEEWRLEHGGSSQSD